MTATLSVPQSQSPAVAVCSACGCTSTLSDQFRIVSFGRLFCPGCVAQRAARWGLVPGIAVLVFGCCVVLLSRATAVIPAPVLFILANLSIFCIVLAFSVLVHELGHTLSFWLFGGRVFLLRWGIGRMVVHRRLRDLTLILGANLYAGMTIGGFPTLRMIRLRFGLMLLGGPIANLLLAYILYMRLGDWDGSALASNLAWSEMTIMANVLLALSSLFPRRVVIGAAAMPTDGAWLLTLAAGNISPAAIHRIYFAAGVTQAIDADDLASAQALEAEAQSLYPDVVAIQEMAVMTRLVGGDVVHALPFYEAILTGEEFAKLTGPQQALLLNNTAWAGLLMGGLANLELATERACVAFAMMPWQPSIRGTYGALLVERGDLTHGESHLNWAFRHHEDQRSKAIVLAYCALAQQRRGRSGPATQTLARANAMSPFDLVVKRIAQEIERSAEAGT